MTGSNTNTMTSKLTLFKRIKELAEQQEDCLFKDRFDSFLSLLTQRSRIQRKIDQQDELAARSNRGPEGGPLGSQSELIVQQIKDIIASIQKTDRKIEEVISKQQAGLISEIKELRQGKKAMRGYGGKSGYTPRYIDQHK